MMTLIDFEKIPNGVVFANGVLPNSEEGIFMTRNGGDLRWVAKKGGGHDWAIYCFWSSYSEWYVAQHGDKVLNKTHIMRCVPCDDDVFKLYRY